MDSPQKTVVIPSKSEGLFQHMINRGWSSLIYHQWAHKTKHICGWPLSWMSLGLSQDEKTWTFLREHEKRKGPLSLECGWSLLLAKNQESEHIEVFGYSYHSEEALPVLDALRQLCILCKFCKPSRQGSGQAPPQDFPNCQNAISSLGNCHQSLLQPLIRNLTRLC